jgi:basic membrane protein A
VTRYDLAVDGVGYSTSGGFIDDITADLDGYKQQIIDGEITVPTS